MLLLLSLALAAAPPPTLAGTWKLDPARSSDPSAVLALLGVPSYLAWAANDVTQVITLGPESITVEVRTTFKTAMETMSLATGASATGALFDIQYVVKPRVDGGAIAASGTITLEAWRRRSRCAAP